MYKAKETYVQGKGDLGRMYCTLPHMVTGGTCQQGAVGEGKRGRGGEREREKERERERLY